MINVGEMMRLWYHGCLATRRIVPTVFMFAFYAQEWSNDKDVCYAYHFDPNRDRPSPEAAEAAAQLSRDYWN